MLPSLLFNESLFIHSQFNSYMRDVF